MMGPGDSTETELFDKIAAWEEQKRRQDAEYTELLAAEEAAAEARLARIRQAKGMLAPAMTAATVAAMTPPAAPPPVAPRHPAATREPREPDSIPAAIRTRLRKENLHYAIPTLLSYKNGLSFQELLSAVQEFKHDVSPGSLHSALGRLREKEVVDFVGHRGSMTYHLITDARIPSPTRAKSEADASTDTSMESILNLLRDRPRMPIKEMAMIIYNDDSEHGQGNVRSNLSKLKAAGKARNIARGEWEAIVEE